MDEVEYREYVRSQEIHLVDWQYVRLLNDDGMPGFDLRVIGMIESAPAPYYVGERVVTDQILKAGEEWCETFRQRYYLHGQVAQERLMTVDQLRQLRNEIYSRAD